MIGTIISHYRVTAKLGAGGMGEVYRAEDTRLGRQVALKVMMAASPAPIETWEKLLRSAADEKAQPTDASRQRSADPRTRFLREARTVSALNHPGIVTIYDVGEWQGRLFIAMELVEGETLRRKLDSGAMNTKATIKMSITLAEALQRAHAAGVVHRDIKPENIIISTEGQTKLLDFGIAKLRRPDAEKEADGATLEALTVPGFILGTIHYMSPEQARSEEIDPRSDLFSLGSVIYECLAGRKAFSGNNVDALFAITHHPAPPLRQYDMSIPSDIESVVEKLMEKDREDRYQSAADLLVDLRRAERRLSAGMTTGAVPPPSLTQTAGQIAPPVLPAQPTQSGDRAVPAPLPVPPPRPGHLPTWLTMISLAAAIALAAALLYQAMNQTKLSPQEQTYPVTHLHKSISQPALSPDGKLITFISGDNQVYVALTQGGEATQLTKTTDTNAYPRFSADGSRILFTRRNPGDLWEIPALGGEARRVAADALYGAWSPDGSQLAFSRADSGTSLALFVGGAHGESPRRIARVEGQPNMYPVWTRDGKQVVYVEAYTELHAPRLMAAAADGSSPPRTLASLDLVSQPAAVSLDGWVYYGAIHDGLVNLWRIPVSGGEPKQVTFSTGEDQSPALDPNGWIYYVSARHRARLHLVDESGTRPLADDTLVSEASLSPDGSRVAFVRPQWSGTTLGDLMLLNRDSGHVQRVDTPALVKAIHWSPDGKRIGYESRATGTFQAGVVDLESGRNTPIPSPGHSTKFVAFSPAGQYLIDEFGADMRIDVAVFDPASGKERTVAQNVNSIGFSSDGKWIGLFETPPRVGAPQRILVVPAEGGEPQPIYTGPARAPFFAPDPTRVIFFTSLAPPQLQSVVVNGGNGALPVSYASQVLLSAFTEFGPQALMDFDFAHQRALVSVNESDMDIVRREANP